MFTKFGTCKLRFNVIDPALKVLHCRISRDSRVLTLSQLGSVDMFSTTSNIHLSRIRVPSSAGRFEPS